MDENYKAGISAVKDNMLAEYIEIVCRQTGGNESCVSSYIQENGISSFRKNFEALDIDRGAKERLKDFYKFRDLTETLNTFEDRTCITEPQDVYKLIKADIAYKNKEYFCAMFLNVKGNVIKKNQIISIGDISSAIVNPREVFLEAIKNGAATMILTHNHPSGEVNPSMEDINITKRLYLAGKILNIEVVDHVIVAEKGFYSFRKAMPDLFDNKEIERIFEKSRWQYRTR